ncbi:MAG TPA: class I SAM-dependent methyltransferase [Candidatus Saccharimonadales bacterium]|nr:class I SAM-dependent methyltransferase [Candidatus Saccharimonadales bacterium]
MAKTSVKIKSHSFIYSDFDTDWYKNWAKKLKQTEKGKGKYHLYANKFWQNAVMVQALFERGVLEDGKTCIGFGVGKERLPALFASMGVKVTATDQDFTQAKAKEWDNDQLAEGAFSLNEDGICKPEDFARNVEFMPVDMTKIPKKLNGKYDFLWSNCALGHLGSIEKSLEFITKSLDCLKPGGWAVHTTEFNILSNDETVTSGSTVIFRAKDIYNLCVELTKKGFICSPYHLVNGRTNDDARVTLRPEWGNDYTKLLVGGHIATQIVLVIQKPPVTMSPIKQKLELAKQYQAYKSNLIAIKNVAAWNPTLKLLRRARGAIPSNYKITPVKKTFSVASGKKQLIVEFVNESNLPLMGVYEALFGTKPIVLATFNPINRESDLATKEWFSSNRPAIKLYERKGDGWQPADYIAPHESFAFVFDINSSKKRTHNAESFIVVQEGADIVAESDVSVQIKK